MWIPQAAGLKLMGDLPPEIVVSVWDGAETPLDDAGEVRVVVPTYSPKPVIADVLAGLPRLELVQALTTGIDRIRPYIPEGVALASMRGVHGPAASEWVVTAILASLREFPRLFDDQRSGNAELKDTQTLDGKRVTIVGYGEIGSAVERRLSGWDVTFDRVARSAREGVRPVGDLDELLPKSDIVVITAPLTPETRDLISRERLAALPDGALVVNAARAGIVDEQALYEELVAGRLRAALDVTDPDPLPADHQLRSAPNLIYTPHVAGQTVRKLPLVYEQIGRQLVRVLRGETPIDVQNQPDAGAVAAS